MSTSNSSPGGNEPLEEPMEDGSEENAESMDQSANAKEAADKSVLNPLEDLNIIKNPS